MGKVYFMSMVARHEVLGDYEAETRKLQEIRNDLMDKHDILTQEYQYIKASDFSISAEQECLRRCRENLDKRKEMIEDIQARSAEIRARIAYVHENFE